MHVETMALDRIRRASIVRTEQLAYQWTDFHEISHTSTFLKSVGKIRI